MNKHERLRSDLCVAWSSVVFTLTLECCERLLLVMLMLFTLRFQRLLLVMMLMSLVLLRRDCDHPQSARSLAPGLTVSVMELERTRRGHGGTCRPIRSRHGNNQPIREGQRLSEALHEESKSVKLRVHQPLLNYSRHTQRDNEEDLSKT